MVGGRKEDAGMEGGEKVDGVYAYINVGTRGGFSYGLFIGAGWGSLMR